MQFAPGLERWAANLARRSRVINMPAGALAVLGRMAQPEFMGQHGPVVRGSVTRIKMLTSEEVRFDPERIESGR